MSKTDTFGDERMKKDAEPSVLLPAPTKGRREQHLASAPREGARLKHCLLSQEPCGSGWSFPGSSNSTLARRSIVVRDPYPAAIIAKISFAPREEILLSFSKGEIK